jgi:hypothetical protein
MKCSLMFCAVRYSASNHVRTAQGTHWPRQSHRLFSGRATIDFTVANERNYNKLTDFTVAIELNIYIDKARTKKGRTGTIPRETRELARVQERCIEINDNNLTHFTVAIELDYGNLTDFTAAIQVIYD